MIYLDSDSINLSNDSFSNTSDFNVESLASSVPDLNLPQKKL